VADRRVVVASPEADQLYCLDLASGQLQWDRARRQALYVGPVVGTQVLVVSNDQIEAIDLQRGTQSWSSGTLPEGATVGGFGLLSEGAYLLPLVDGRMASVDATSGEVTSMITARETNSLGNLIYHRGAVVSQSIDGLQRFDQAQALRERTRNQLATNPNDTEALRTLAEFSLIEGDIPEAIGRLLQAYEVDRTDPLVRERLTDALLAGLRSDYAAYRQQASVLDELIPSGARHVELLRLHVDGCATQQAADQALDYAWQLFIADGDQLIRDSDEYSVLSERWFNARVVRLWDMASPEARERFGRASQNWLNQIAAGARLEGLGRYYRFCKQLPPSSEVALELAEGLLAAERHREAELILLECERWPLSGAQPQRLTSAWQQLLPTSQTQLPEPAAWPAGRVQVEQQRLDQAPPVATRMNRNNQPQRHRLLSRGDSYRYFGGQQLAIDGSGSELVGWNQRGDVEFRHLIEVEEPTGTETPEALRFGQYCVLNEQSEVVVLDLAARQGAGDEAVLWRSRATENSSRSQYIQRIQNGRIVYVSRDNMTGMLDSRYGKVCAAGPGGIVVCNERQLSCFDVLSGDLLWRRRLESDVQLPPLADREHLYLAGGAWGIVVRLADGEIVGKWIPRETKFVASHGSRYVTVNLRSGRRQLQMVDAATDQVLLQRDYATSVELVRGDRDRLYAVDPTGTLDAVDLAAARLAWSAKIEVEPGLDSASTLTDGVTLFLATNTRTQAQHRAAGRETVGNAPVADGHVYCLDFGSGERRWSRAATVSGVGMLELQPLESPVLVLAAQLTDRSSDNTQWVSLLCLDRASGRSVLRDDRLKPLVGVPPTIRVETGAQPAVLINLHHTLVRLQLTDEPFAPEPVSLAEVEAQAGRKKSGLFNTLGRILGGGIESRPTEADDD
jgi:outer membrane protein assembly factor BamB